MGGLSNSAKGAVAGGVIGGAPGSTIGAFTGADGLINSGGPTPEHKIADLDSQSQAAIQNQRAQGNKSEQDIINERMQGVDQTGQLKQALSDQGLIGSASNGQSGDNEALRQALSARAQRSSDQDLTNIRRQTEFQAPLIKQDYAAQAFQNLARQQQVMAGIAKRKQGEQQANAQMRGQLISSILGAGFIAGGSALGNEIGGREGAKAGARAGKGVASSQTPGNSGGGY